MDDDIAILITIMEILHEFCADLGPASVDHRLERITDQLIKIFQNETNAQNQAFEVFLPYEAYINRLKGRRRSSWRIIWRSNFPRN